MKKNILQSIQKAIMTMGQLKEPKGLEFLEKSSYLIADCFYCGNKIITAGNGGSLCDAAHFAEELTGYFRGKRRALPAIVLNDPGHMTCVANDVGFENIFSRSIEAFGKKGDLFIGLTTSGNSPNLVKAFEKAHELSLKTIAFLGKGGGKLKGVADLELIIDGSSTSDRIQEAHMLAIHVMIETVENILFSKDKEEKEQEQLMMAGG